MSGADEDRPGLSAAQKGWIRTGISFVVLAAAVAVAVRYLLAEEEAIAQLLAADPILIVCMIGLLAACMVMNGLVTHDVVACFGINLRVREWMGITLVTSMLNLVTPGRGGTALRGLYLKRAHGLPYAQFAGTLGATLAFTLWANAGLGAIALLLIGIPGGASGQVALATCIGIVIAVAMVLLLARDRSGRQNDASPGWLARVIRGWQRIAADRVLLSRLALWSVINALAHAGAFAIAFSSAGGSGSHLAAVASSAFSKIGAVIAVTPAALGIFEAFAVVSARIVGEGLAASLLAVMLIRIVSVSLSVVGGAVMWNTLTAEYRGAPPDSHTTGIPR